MGTSNKAKPKDVLEGKNNEKILDLYIVIPIILTAMKIVNDNEKVIIK